MRHDLLVWVLIAAVAASALLAGCVQPEPEPSLAYAPGFHPQPYRNLTLEALALPETVVPGQTHEWRIRVVHAADSEDTFVYSAVCQSPWVVELSDAYGEDLHTTEMHGVCLAYGEARLEPGASQELVWEWDGRHHPQGGPDGQDLSPGSYVLSVQFESIKDRGEGPRAFHVFEVR